ncbi:hypothetical protein Hs30E_13030 [Lactococcus hodotermopsidis]|uniref:Uncharacterized protein n=1 Tax=Pseudolactococcus hodotermopsidis TaxID=2709157 RepID=A0A6A0BBN5_9LACT|nr:hypothetical protein [Lactococcus hodotermopsidis]GFH42752.1 hypothetical protein Hs30E_13030 [Lactococcus hodotermopsidis]
MSYKQLVTPDIDTPSWRGWCLGYVDDALNALDSNRSYSAQIGYERAKAKGWVHNDMNFPSDVWFPLFWAINIGNNAGDGHVALAKMSNGNIEIHDSEVHAGARVPYRSLEEINGWFAAFGFEYLGWSIGVDGVQVIEEIVSEPSAPVAPQLKGQSKMECIVVMKDNMGGAFKKDRVFFWSADQGFKYLEDKDDIKILDDISNHCIGKPMYRVESSKQGPWHARLAQINGSCDIK